MSNKEIRSLASNLIYNDGGEDKYVGFSGRCSIENIVCNTSKKGRWCSQPENSCYKYLRSGFTKFSKDYPCNESRVFDYWTWNAGNDFRTGEAFYIRGTAKGKYCILTTQFANTSERDRRIVGLFRISQVENDEFLRADSRMRIRLTLEQSMSLYFWSYYFNLRKPLEVKWSSKRFRYLSDEQVCAILHDIYDLAESRQQKELVAKAIREDFSHFGGVRPNVVGAIPKSALREFYIRRKYGKGGESEAHKKLKHYIANNPSLLGLPRSAKATIEHLFVSGDMVDILFEYNGKSVVVEIELDNVIPGIHQAIKYRALRCSQQGRPIGDNSVKAFVVAWGFSKESVTLCDKYNILKLECKV